MTCYCLRLDLQSFLSGISWRNLVVSVESWSLWRSSDSSVSSGSDSNNSSVDSARNTVVQLVVGLWKSIFSVDRGFRQISDSSSFNDVSDSHSLDGLVLWNRSGTVDTSDRLDVTSTLLVSTVGSSLLWHSVKVYSMYNNLVQRQQCAFTNYYHNNLC